jgi:hypothetical protein
VTLPSIIGGRKINRQSAYDGVISVLSSFAIQSHELFMELKNAGFDEEQALKIVVGLAHKE